MPSMEEPLEESERSARGAVSRPRHRRPLGRSREPVGSLSCQGHPTRPLGSPHSDPVSGDKATPNPSPHTVPLFCGSHAPRLNHLIDRLGDPISNRAQCPDNHVDDPGERPLPTWGPWRLGRDHWDNDSRPSRQTSRQPTAYLAEVTSLSPGLPPQRLPGVREPQQALNPVSGSFRRGIAQ